MKKQALGWTACSIAVLMAVAASSSLTPALAGARFLPTLRVHYSGLLNDSHLLRQSSKAALRNAGQNGH